MDTDLADRNHALIRLEHAGFRYGGSEKPVLADVSLHLSAGEMMAIVGKSGVGKSTLMRVMGGELQPTTGTVYRSAALGAPGTVAQVDQDCTVFPWKKVSRIVELALSRAIGTDQISSNIGETLATFGLEGAGERYPQELSGGMRQRLALAFAILRRPRVLLLDEPFGSLDDFTKESLYRLIHERLHGTTTALVFITHNLSECLTLSDRVLVLGGRPSASIVERFVVNGPKPRSATMLLNPEFVVLNRQILQAIGSTNDSPGSES